MSSAKDPHSILNRNPELGKFQVPKPKPKITRYFPGKAPEWEKEENSDEDIFPGEYELKSIGDTSITSEKMNKRLAILEELNKKETNHVRNEERVVARSEVIEKKMIDTQKKIEEPRVIQAKINESGVEIVGSKEREERRAALKARLLAKEGENQNIVNSNSNTNENNTENRNTEVSVQRNNNNNFIVENSKNNQETRMKTEEKLHEIDEDENEEGFEEEMEEENEEEGGIINILKPIYVKKNERSGMADKLVLEEIALEEERKKINERRKIEAKILVSEAVKRTNDDDEDAEKSNSEQGLPDDNDEIEQDQELESWKIRELKRVKRDREERHRREKELSEIQRRRNLTDEERRIEDLKLGSDHTEKKEKQAYRFLQKYYHKGAFFMDTDDPILQRDYNVAVGEDLFDKSNLPSILKKRRGNFGKKGQSKYTHLTDQDTTNFDPAWKPDENLREKMYARMAGLKGSSVMERKDLKKLKI